MTQASKGDTVLVHYEGRLDDGSQFDSSQGREPLEITLGEGRVIPGFETAVEGMEVGEKKTVTLPADEAYGAHNPELIHKVAREQVPESIDLQVGMELQAMDQNQNPIRFSVMEFDDNVVVLDANHPLAGKELTFDLELVELKAA
ncbi:MAG: FKBP-type peptidyl-prolyl cis-trans isomerase [Minwuia sp.]|uniref:FKBP-type peptidyl-prolyl cis-trans isomerase n=1 Tax=Minwuia sp. TaxID=2493630 RepID=UPI003A8B24E3